MTAYDIGKMIYRPDFDTPSTLESLLEQCSTASSAQSSPDLASLCLEPGLAMPPSPTRIDMTPGSPAITMRVEFTSPEASPKLFPFPSLSLNTDAEPTKLNLSTSTPSTRASSPLTGAPPALELPRLKDFEREPFMFLDQAEESGLPPAASLFDTPPCIKLNSWPADRTKLFRQKMEEAFLNICSPRLH